MKMPTFIDIKQCREVLAEMGIELSERQIKRAADPDPHGKRKLPFFVDPIDGRLKIEKGILVRIYQQAQIDAENNCRF
jgi:hypothetical protein